MDFGLSLERVCFQRRVFATARPRGHGPKTRRGISAAQLDSALVEALPDRFANSL